VPAPAVGAKATAVVPATAAAGLVVSAPAGAPSVPSPRRGEGWGEGLWDSR
jgi:hypothetical protein